MRRLPTFALLAALTVTAAATAAPAAKSSPVNMNPPPLSGDASVRYDYDIVYVRAPRQGDDHPIHWNDVFNTLRSEPGSDLMLLHPDGREEVLVAAGENAVTDPFVSFDGEWVYYAFVHNVNRPGDPKPVPTGSDIYKIHVKSRKIVRLTSQEFTPNTGVAGKGRNAGVFNIGPCPLPGRKVVFTSNRNGFQPTKGYTATTLQLFVMDDDGANVEEIGYLNINTALHPTILKDGRVMFTSYESQGLRDLRLWSVWAIRPDGTNWEPLVSNLGFDASAFHFMTQLSDEHIVVEEYYNLHNQGFGTYYKLAPRPPEGQPFFGSAYRRDPRNLAYLGNATARFPFSPYGMEWMTRFVTGQDSPAPLSDPRDPTSLRVGKLTHPSGAPDNHLLTVWSPGPANRGEKNKPVLDGGLYLIKSGELVTEPGQMRLIKNDPKYNEQWPRALVPYKRIYGVDEPAYLPPLANNGKASRYLPEGTPFGLVGSSSLYKRESYPNGVIRPGEVTATYGGGRDPFQGLGSLAFNASGNWWDQGGDTCHYQNSEIHALRILAMEPTTEPRHMGRNTPLWWNGAIERLRILGEFPVRKFKDGKQPTDPDGNADTSFLVKIPADFAWTFQTLDKNGMVLNMAQTWHQLRPGEVRTDCGGCHAHSQKPTLFEQTAAGQPDFVPFDLTGKTPLLTSKEHDQSGKQWDKDDTTGLRYEKGIKNVEYYRDIKPILDRSCVACHTKKWAKPAGNLVLDDETLMPAPGFMSGFVQGPPGKVPGTYFRLALDQRGQFGYKSPVRNWGLPQVSRYVRLFSARRSLLAWKIFGQRLDGWKNEDFATETVLGDPNSLHFKGSPVKANTMNWAVNLAYSGSAMPPPEAVAGTYEGPNGKKIKVAPLTDEDRRNLVRWIDLGCAIDLDYNPARPKVRGYGWMADDNRPTLTLTYPAPEANTELTRILVGMHDHYTGLDLDTFQVTANFPVDGVPAGRNLARKFKAKGDGVWELKLAKPIEKLPRNRGVLTVSVKDVQGNESRIERTFWITARGK